MQENLNLSASEMINKFVLNSLVVPVTEGAMSSASRLHVDHPEKLDLLRKSAEACLRPLGQVDRTGDLVDGFLNNKLKHDLWYLSLKNGPTVILVKDEVYKKITEREIAEQVHKAEVESAAMRGEHVPDELLRYYRDKSRPHFSYANA